MSRIVMPALLLTAWAALAQTPAPPPSVQVGQAAPDFTATYLTAADANGRRERKTITLSDYKGQKNVVLAFYPAAFSPGCSNEMAQYHKQQGEFSTHNTAILGVSVDSAWANVAFREHLGLDFPVLSDAKRTISESYGVFDEKNAIARRTTFVIDSQGVVQKIFQAQEALDPRYALEACSLMKEIK
jgi:peroxiredoxin